MRDIPFENVSKKQMRIQVFLIIIKVFFVSVGRKKKTIRRTKVHF